VPLTVDESRLIDKILREAGLGDREFFDSLSDHEQSLVLQILEDLKTTGKSPDLDVLWETDYESQPVSVDDFIDDPYYLGVIGKQVYPAWRGELTTVLDPSNQIIEWVVSGAIGTGKTTITVIAQLYKIYRLMCLKNPQRFYNLMEGSTIYFGLFNLTLNLVQSVTFLKLVNLLRLSPYFKDKTGLRQRPNPRDSEVLKLPKNIAFAFGSSILHTLGEDTFSGILSEVNFATPGTANQVIELYKGVKRRMESRFLRTGLGVPGLLVIDSSKRNEGDFVEKHVQDSQDMDSVHVTNFAIWDVKKYSSKTFSVIVGDRVRKSQVIEPGSAVPENVPEDKIVNVPMDWYPQFKLDVEGALRDHAGIATYALSPLVRDRSKVFANIDIERRHPFVVEESQISLDDDLSLLELFEIEQVFDVIDPYTDMMKPRFNPGVLRYAHIDLAITQDSAGLAIVHLAGHKIVERTLPDGVRTRVQVPYVFVDLMMRIRPTPGSEIDFGKIREFVIALRSKGMPFGGISYDKFQSTDSLQIFKKQLFNVKQISVDKKADAYVALRDAIHEQRISYYEYKPFIDEITTVQFDRAKYRVDHMATGSKDVSDAVAGATFHALTDKISEHQGLAPVQQEPKETKTPFEVMREADWVATDYKSGGGRITGIIR
jgi:hypothetical protein